MILEPQTTTTGDTGAMTNNRRYRSHDDNRYWRLEPQEQQQILERGDTGATAGATATTGATNDSHHWSHKRQRLEP